MRLPLDYLDKLCLAGTTEAHGTSCAPVWQLLVQGQLDVPRLRTALARLAQRYPVLVSSVAARRPGKAWDAVARADYLVDPEPDVDALLEVVEVEDEAALEALRRRIFDHYMEVECDYLLRVIWAPTGPEGGVLFVQQHHAIADGKAFFELLADLCTLYDQAHDEPDAAWLVPVPRVPEAAMVEARPWARRWMALQGFGWHLRGLVRGLVARADALYSNRWSDEPGGNRVVHLLLDGAVLTRLRALKPGTGLSPNDALSAALALALARWSGDCGAPMRRSNLLLPADMRPRRDPPRSFANHISSYILEYDWRGPLDLAALTRSTHDQIRLQARHRAPHKRLVAETMVAGWLPVGLIRRTIYGASTTPFNLSFSNLIPISPPEPLGTCDFTTTGLRILTPNGYLNGVNTTVIHYAGQLCFNFNHKEGVVSEAEARALMARFQEALEQVLAACEAQ